MRVWAVLEAYCRGLDAGGLRGLARQVGAVGTMEELATLVRERNDSYKVMGGGWG